MADMYHEVAVLLLLIEAASEDSEEVPSAEAEPAENGNSKHKQ